MALPLGKNPPDSSAPERAPDPDCPPSATPDLEAQRSRVAALGEKVGALEAELEDAIGKPLEFPADLEAPFRPENARATVAAVLEEAGEGELVGVDCSEYPCIASIRIPRLPRSDPFDGPAAEALEEAFQSTGYMMGGYREGMPAFAAVAVAPDNLDPAFQTRLRRYRYVIAAEEEEAWRRDTFPMEDDDGE